MLSRFIKYSEENNLIISHDKLILAVSGGLDSTVMAELFHQAKLTFGIAHCNFRLRENESDADEDFVKQLAEKYQVPFHHKTFETTTFAEESKISIQMAARRLRYEWFEELIKTEKYNSYSTAHHLDDQIETFFINILRGTGIAGLHGILPKQGNLIHPMLFCYRSEILEFAKGHNLNFREDSSNKKKSYTRNKIRHDLLKMIEEINPSYRNIINENINRVQQAEIIYNKKIKEEGSKVINQSDGIIKIEIEKLALLSPLKTYLYEILKPYNFNFSDVKDITTSLHGIAGKQFYSKSHRLIKDRNFLLIEELPTSTMKDELCISGIDTLINNPVHLKINKFEKRNDFIIPSSSEFACLDFEKLEFPLILRKWKKGDYFYPLGMKNKKLISDFFIDNKFSIFQKEQTFLLTSGNDIVWIIGHRIDNRYKISSKTKIIYQVVLIL